MSEPIANLYAILTADPAVSAAVADRVYMTQAEQGAQAPFVVWQLIANTPGLLLAGRPTFDNQLLQCDVYSRTQSEARAIAFACRDAIEGGARVTRGPIDAGTDKDTGLQRWTLDASFVWERAA